MAHVGAATAIEVALPRARAARPAWARRFLENERLLAVLLLAPAVVLLAVFIAYPFVCRCDWSLPVLPWATAALAGPLHFYLIHSAVKQAYPNEFMGLLPAAFTVPMLAASDAASTPQVIAGLVAEGADWGDAQARARWREYYFGDTAPGASMQRWRQAVLEVAAERDRWLGEHAGTVAPADTLPEDDESDQG